MDTSLILLEEKPLSLLDSVLSFESVPKHGHFLFIISLLLSHLEHLLSPIVCVHSGNDHTPDIATDSHTDHIEHISNKLFIISLSHINIHVLEFGSFGQCACVQCACVQHSLDQPSLDHHSLDQPSLDQHSPGKESLEDKEREADNEYNEDMV